MLSVPEDKIILMFYSELNKLCLSLQKKVRLIERIKVPLLAINGSSSTFTIRDRRDTPKRKFAPIATLDRTSFKSGLATNVVFCV